MNQKLLPHIDIGSPQAKFSVIWLHGLGANGYDFEPIISDLKLGELSDVRFIFPHAPHIPISINGGMEMPGWYDIFELAKIGAQQDKEGIHQSAQFINAFIENEISRGVPSENIFLAGFSQGGAIALQTGLRYPKKLAGILALSSYLPLHETVENELSNVNKGISIMMAHGKQDPIINYHIGKLSREFIENKGLDVEWYEYDMEHTVIPAEISDISKWFKKIIRHQLK